MEGKGKEKTGRGGREGAWKAEMQLKYIAHSTR